MCEIHVAGRLLSLFSPNALQVSPTISVCKIPFQTSCAERKRSKDRFSPLPPTRITWQGHAALVFCLRQSPAPSTCLSPHSCTGSCKFALPTPVCENNVRPFPSGGNPTRSPITIGERVLEQELPNDSQSSPSCQLHLTAHFFLCLVSDVLPPYQNLRTPRTKFVVFSCCILPYNFRFINLSKEFHCLTS